MAWPNGADVEPNILYDWPRHVDAIVQRRRQRWTVEYGEAGSREKFGRVLQKVAEADREPYEADRLPEDTGAETADDGSPAASGGIYPFPPADLTDG